MQRSTLWSLAAFIAAALSWQAAPASPRPTVEAAPPVTAAVPLAVRKLAQQVLESGDHRRQPFAIVDKQAAVIVVYRGDGTLAGASSALLGQTLGDESVPGVGERAQSRSLRHGDRTTAAGRFASQPGRTDSGDEVVWLDYDNALSIHRLRRGPSWERRAQGLASTSPLDKRLSDGCVVVHEAFYESVVQPLLGRGRGVVYVMPETMPLQQWQPLIGARDL